MNPNEQLLERFYTCFGKRDHAGMIACYSPSVKFTDPIFELRGNQVGAMWRMLCESGKDVEITFRDIKADEQAGSVHWEARYTFSLTGRRVQNVIDGKFVFQEGAIVQHSDHFDFWRWSRMALGPAGMVLGWTPALRRRVQRTAQENLNRFIAKHPDYKYQPFCFDHICPGRGARG
jgi:hypothetical protein